MKLLGGGKQLGGSPPGDLKPVPKYTVSVPCEVTLALAFFGEILIPKCIDDLLAPSNVPGNNCNQSEKAEKKPRERSTGS